MVRSEQRKKGIRTLLGKTRRVHFVGIGGVGMSGIAEVLVNLGFTVSGSDIERSTVTERLASIGARIRYRHSARNIRGSDVVVVSSAISSANPEIVAAEELGIPVIPRTDMLSELMRMRTGVAVAGAHGKTTTTSLAATVLQEAGLDPTVVVGGRVKGLRSNARLGEGEFLVAEADESDGNFVRLSPVYAIITNIDAEHLDFYGGLERIYDAFVQFARTVPFYGAVICCADNPHVQAILPRIGRRILTYGFHPDVFVQGEIAETGPTGTAFTLMVGGKRRGRLFLRMPGRYNVQNALGVCALAEELGIKFSDMRAAFSGFEGVARRLEIKGEAGGILFVDDYGHHPTEIEATVETVHESYRRRLIVVFQPHRYTRTRDLHQRFEKSFKDADEVFVTEIYPAGERPIPGVNGELVYRAVLKGGASRVSYFPAWKDLRAAVLASIKPGDLVLTLGAGNIWKLGEELCELVESRGKE
ncbi:MAG: UDP-N-acetylmuramate--L-alanine ligase [bacterium]|nr:MAG: UDP-N-acetylmuramate--L-alanine ligase [bacterium]